MTVSSGSWYWSISLTGSRPLDSVVNRTTDARAPMIPTAARNRKTMRAIQPSVPRRGGRVPADRGAGRASAVKRISGTGGRRVAQAWSRTTIHGEVSGGVPPCGRIAARVSARGGTVVGRAEAGRRDGRAARPRSGSARREPRQVDPVGVEQGVQDRPRDLGADQGIRAQGQPGDPPVAGRGGPDGQLLVGLDRLDQAALVG